MLILSLIIFWIPVFAGTLYFLLHTNWNKERLTIAAASVPTIFFAVKTCNYSYTDPLYLFVLYLLGLFISLVILISCLRYFSRTKKREK
jgi:O-antigen/teichoic acid export membrane protein